MEEELDCQRYVALDDLVDECSGALDLHVSIETPALSRRVSSSICAARRSASFSRPALSSSTANRSRRSKGISESRRPSQASRQGHAAYPSSYSRDPAHAARRADLGGSRFPRHVARGPAGPLRALPPRSFARRCGRNPAKSRYVSVVESMVDSGITSDQKKNSNDFWSEWQDSNLRPLRPERSALPG